MEWIKYSTEQHYHCHVFFLTTMLDAVSIHIAFWYFVFHFYCCCCFFSFIRYQKKGKKYRTIDSNVANILSALMVCSASKMEFRSNNPMIIVPNELWVRVSFFFSLADSINFMFVLKSTCSIDWVSNLVCVQFRIDSK